MCITVLKWLCLAVVPKPDDTHQTTETRTYSHLWSWNLWIFFGLKNGSVINQSSEYVHINFMVITQMINWEIIAGGDHCKSNTVSLSCATNHHWSLVIKQFIRFPAKKKKKCSETWSCKGFEVAAPFVELIKQMSQLMEEISVTLWT